MQRVHVAVVLLLAVAQASTVSYSLDLRDWVVDFQRPTASPRVAPFDIQTGSKLEASLANNSYPGPELSAVVGDILEVTVTNNMLISEAGIVFEGMQQQKGPSFISPQGGVGTYSMLASSPGTYWWHASSPLVAAQGLRGAIVIRNNSLSDDTKLTILSDARPTPNVCFDSAGQWDQNSCPEINKATFNGVWGDGSKEYPAAIMEVIQGHCYTLRVLGFAVQSHNAFDLSIQDHTFSLPTGEKGVKDITVHPNVVKAAEVELCADQKPVLSHDYTITYSLYNVSNVHAKKSFTAILRYI
jgi:FtsP/CotA-like multicopper oxidase with cupredoxin domain